MIKKGQKPKQGDILWTRKFPLGRDGKPINLRKTNNRLPAIFWKMCKGVTYRGKDYTFDCYPG